MGASCPLACRSGPSHALRGTGCTISHDFLISEVPSSLNSVRKSCELENWKSLRTYFLICQMSPRATVVLMKTVKFPAGVFFEVIWSREPDPETPGLWRSLGLAQTISVHKRVSGTPTALFGGPSVALIRHSKESLHTQS